MSYIEKERIIINNFIEKCINIPLSYKKKEAQLELESISSIVSYSQIQLKLITTEDKNSYILIAYGYDIPQRHGSRTILNRIRDCVLHVEIDNKVVKIYQDKLQYGIANELIEAGISQNRILHLCPQKQDYVKYIVNLKKAYEFNQDCFSSNSSFENPVLKPELTSIELTKLKELDLEYFNKVISKYI